MTGKPSMLYRLTGGRVGQAAPDETTTGRPGSPCGCEGQSGSNGQAHTRREFLAWFGVGLTGVAATLAGIPILGSFFSTPPRAEQVWHPVGTLDDFSQDDTVMVEFEDVEAVPWAGPAARNAVYLRRIGEEEFTAFSIYCTHVGCPVSWRAGASMFICPCHGGVFDREGEVIAGPPETPLGRHDVRVREGRVEVLAAPVPVTG